MKMMSFIYRCSSVITKKKYLEYFKNFRQFAFYIWKGENYANTVVFVPLGPHIDCCFLAGVTLK